MTPREHLLLLRLLQYMAILRPTLCKRLSVTFFCFLSSVLSQRHKLHTDTCTFRCTVYWGLQQTCAGAWDSGGRVSEWAGGDTVPCPCGPSRCTSVHKWFWSRTHWAYPEPDQAALHETPSQTIALQIHAYCKEKETDWLEGSRQPQNNINFVTS